MRTISKLSVLLVAATMTGCIDNADDAVDQPDPAVEAEPEAEPEPDDDSSPAEPRGSKTPTAVLVGCTSYGCDYKDPSAMGCLGDAQLLRTAWITYSASYLAKIEGWYSPACGAQWTRTINWSSSPATIEASQKIGATLYGVTWVSNAPSGYSVSSKMFSAAYFAQACGEWSAGYENCSTGF
jgi:hypothetical protein